MSETVPEEEGPFLVLLDSTYDEHYFVGPFSSIDEANAFVAEGKSGGPYEDKAVTLISPEDFLAAFPVPEEPEATPQSGDDLDNLSKDELLARAQALGVSPANAAMSKGELKAAIQEKQGTA